MGAASLWAMTFLQLLTPWEYRPADCLTRYVEEGNVLTGHSQRRISVAEMREVTAGTRRLEWEPCCTVPLLSIILHPLARGNLRSWYPHLLTNPV